MSHYYDLEGNSRYTVPYADPKKGERPTTLRDAKKNNWVPSVTTIMQVAAKPGLDRWKRDQLLEAAMEIEYCSWSDDADVYKRQVVARSTQKSEEAAKRGTELHDALEHYYLTGELGEDKEFIEPAIQLIDEHFTKIKWFPEESFAHLSGFGGKVDLYSTVTDGMHNYHYVLDFKTKSDASKMKAYDEHRMQLAAYADGLGLYLPKTKYYNLFIGTQQPGEVLLIEHSPEEMHRARLMFYHLLRYWQQLNNYVPEFK